MSIQQNIEKIKSEIGSAQLICVSKYHTEDEIMEAYNLGLRDFGENKVQDLIKKQENLPKDIRWHLIGHLQTNKVKYLIGKTHLIQSVDKVELADLINKKSFDAGVTTDILVQVNSTGIESRFGVEPEKTVEFIKEILKFKNLNIKGLMGMAPICDNPRPYFENLKKLFDECKSLGILNGDILSMGMSLDYKSAVDCGSTMVRIGNKIFA
ncbi:MAG: YggS family pyridoxal phosphate-dependent enzyme [Clostridia bacterium]|nr:YggS family pyridoxal phosphate-dependent enzyme [Clostridia bacterium]